jgi:HTH-type transcriptional regulator, sugar sensing transcriptional regulator
MDLITPLTEIGFTEYEAKVYLALLRDHPATGYLISKQAGIPRSMVYEALGRLDARGAVLKTEEAKATLYRPMPPETLLDRLADDYQQRMSTLRGGLDALYTARDEGHLWTFSGEGPVLSYARDMLAGAQVEAMLVLTDTNLQALHDDILAADRRGVAVGALLTGQQRLEVGQVAYHPPRESQLHKLADSLVVVVDEQEVLIASAHPTCTATVTTNDNMVQIGRQFVWMELFAHRIFARLPADVIVQLELEPEERLIFDSIRSQDNGQDLDE